MVPFGITLALFMFTLFAVKSSTQNKRMAGPAGDKVACVCGHPARDHWTSVGSVPRSYCKGCAHEHGPGQHMIHPRI